MNRRKKIKCEVDNDGDDDESPEKKVNHPTKCYKRRVPKKWFDDPKLNTWVAESTKNENKAYCIVCEKELMPNIVVIERHRKTEKHSKNMIKHNICSSGSNESSKIIKRIKSEKSKGSPIISIAGQSFTFDEMPGYFSNKKEQTETNKPLKREKEDMEEESDYFTHRNKIDFAPKVEEDEFDIFAKHVAIQLRTLPMKHNLALISDIQNLIMQRRLKVLSEESYEMQPDYSQKVINIMPNGSISS